ncbi:hypothetical protein [Notoacmeibacter sp. MSK16QG-6]|uniref:hypothetical protein n=1 Tax=Notoacmeibacter sp. MSK16QG-6 TaxID=2957982 RepID=UPI00209F750B|nr:hypothetical protein [Notoacmeibacter sp. MSK16QG-6]MCP1200049.1 hypothetical protein [Notoacmeibacter sp. MSK16QG-6]
MALAIWPEEELPRPARNGFREENGEGRRLFMPDDGPPLSRKRRSRVVDTIALILDVTNNQRARIERFVNDELDEGNDFFIMPDWSRHEIPMLTNNGQVITDGDGNTILLSAYMIAMFDEGGLPSYAPRGVDWQVSMRILRMP